MATSRFHAGSPARAAFARDGVLDLPLPGGSGLPAIAPAPFHAKKNSVAEDLGLRVAMLERERAELREELFEASQVQRRVSGPRRLERHGFEIASEIFPVRCLSGDFVCVFEAGIQTWIALGDIGGKGLAAAMWFTHLASLLRCHAIACADAAEVMRRLNADVCALQPAPPLTSMVLFALGGEGRDYCNAGHPAPLILRAAGGVERLETGGPLIGVMPGAAYQRSRFGLGRGDLLLGCTDGILECCNQEGEEFGQERLLEVTRDHAGEPAQALLFSILGRVQDFASGAPRGDDISLLLLRPVRETS